MANRFYPKGAEKVLSAQINFSTDTIKAVLVSNAYTFSTAHEFASSLSVLGAAQTLADTTVAGGVFDAEDLAFGAVAAGAICKAVALYKDTGNAATSPLICYLDEISGFPFSTNGGELSIPWSDGPSKILSLV